jgi:hypothetical protein
MASIFPLASIFPRDSLLWLSAAGFSCFSYECGPWFSTPSVSESSTAWPIRCAMALISSLFASEACSLTIRPLRASTFCPGPPASIVPCQPITMPCALSSTLYAAISSSKLHVLVNPCLHEGNGDCSHSRNAIGVSIETSASSHRVTPPIADASRSMGCGPTLSRLLRRSTRSRL